MIVAAGALGTLRLLFRCRDVTGSLPEISPRLGDLVRTNNESLLGVIARDDIDYSAGIAITSIVHADPMTTIEPVRYSAGSSMMRFLAGPMIDGGGLSPPAAVGVPTIISRPADLPADAFAAAVGAADHDHPGHADRGQPLRFRFGRSLFTLFRRGLVSHPDQERHPAAIEIGRKVTRASSPRRSAASRRAPSTRACSASR